MRHKFFIIFAAVCFFSAIHLSESYAINWIYSLDESLEQAAAEGKPIMMDFYGESCGWCKQLDKETFSDSQVDSLSKNFVCVKIDGNKNPDLLDKYKIPGFPAIIFLNNSGVEMERIIGYREPALFIEAMQRVLSSLPQKTKDSVKYETGSINWLYSYNEALNKARQENKPIMMDLYTEWCGWCKKLDDETYQDKKIIEASINLVSLKIDAEKNPDIAEKYNAAGYPTILFINAQGNVIGGGSGFRNADELLSEIEAALPESSSSTSSRGANIIESSVGSIGAFAKNWWWSIEQKQDGEYAETRITIELPKNIKQASLFLTHNYSQEQGKGEAKVYISTDTQIDPKDEEHYKQSWWTGEAVKLEKEIGSFETQYSGNFPSEFDVTAYLQNHPSNIYYVAVQNLSEADIGVSQIYLLVQSE